MVSSTGMKPAYRYFPVNDSQKAWGLYATCAGRGLTSPGDEFPSSTHPDEYFFSWDKGRILQEWQLFLVESGRGTVEFRHRKFSIQKDSLIILPPGCWHRYRPIKNIGWSTLWIGFGGDLADRLVGGAGFNADGDVIEVKEKNNTITFSANNAMVMPKVEIVTNTTKIYCYHLTDEQFEQANTKWNTPNMGWGILDQSPIQGRILHGIRIKVATIGSISLYMVPSLTESTEMNFQLAATISTSKTGLQDIDFEHPFYLEKDMYLAIGRHSDNVSLVGYYNGDSQSNIQPFCNRIGQSGGITSTQSLMIDFY